MEDRIIEAIEESTNLKTASLREENKRLKQRNELMLKIWSPVLDWGQSKEAGLTPGTDITAEVLRRAKEYAGLKQRITELEEALKDLKKRVEQSDPEFNLPSLNAVLTPKE